MTPEAQRIAIAEACGWKQENPPFERHGAGVDGTTAWWHPAVAGCSLVCPDYPNDLNAMNEAEKVLGQDGESYEYWRLLCEQCHVAWDGNVTWVAVFATAAQRAEAFLRTLNLWKDDSADPGVPRSGKPGEQRE